MHLYKCTYTKNIHKLVDSKCNMQRLVNSIYRSRKFKIVSNSITRRVSCEASLVTKYTFNTCLNITWTM